MRGKVGKWGLVEGRKRVRGKGRVVKRTGAERGSKDAGNTVKGKGKTDFVT